jgi:protein-S-isoprenylcysteine O-methyltransferase Ste14
MKKSLAFLYGVIAYVVFLIAFLYAIGFVGNFFVPKSIDTGTEPGFFLALIINSAVFGLFVLQHSIMARPGFKKWIGRFINPAIERSTFVLLTSLILLLIFWQWQPMKAVIWDAGSGTLSMILWGVFVFGWLVVFLSTFMINHFELFGLKQIFDNLKSKEPESHKLQVKFFYRIVRHPIMLGFIIAFWATPVMTAGHLVFALATTFYIILSVKFLEERDLKKIIGKDYEDYTKKVPMLVPFMKAGK